MTERISRRDLFKIAGVAALALANVPKPIEAEVIDHKEISAQAGDIVTISGQEIKVGGLLFSVDPQENPGKRTTVGIAFKNDCVIPADFGPGVWIGKFQTNGDLSTLYDDAILATKVQSSRNDLAGNCLPEGCIQGSREAVLIAYVNERGRVVYELGLDTERSFTGEQLQLPSNITFLGEVK